MKGAGAGEGAGGAIGTGIVTGVCPSFKYQVSVAFALPFSLRLRSFSSSGTET